MNDVRDLSAAEQRYRHLAQLAHIMPELIGRLAWSREQIDAQRTQALRAMLRHLKQNSPWHAKRIGNLDPDFATLKDLASIPTMTKADLMTHWDEIVTVKGANLRDAEAALRSMTDQSYVWGDHVLLASGGTGGRPGLFLYDWNAMAMNWGSKSRAVMLALQRMGVSGSLRHATIVAEASAHASYVGGRIFSNPENPTLVLSSWRSVDEIVPDLNAFQPEVLSCYSTLAPALANAARKGRLHISPLVILFVAEHLSQYNYRLAKELWPNAKILTFWGTSEAGATFPCLLGGGAFHVSEDVVVVEPVGKDGALPAPGEVSEGIYLTNLHNYALPIIRYHIDDIFDFSTERCQCGSAYQRINEVRGRILEKFSYGAIEVHPLSVELAVLEQSNILSYQIRQSQHGVHIVYSSDGDLDEARLVQKVHATLDSYGLTEPTVKLERVAIIPRTSAGKLRRFVPLG